LISDKRWNTIEGTSKKFWERGRLACKTPENVMFLPCGFYKKWIFRGFHKLKTQKINDPVRSKHQ